jgi:hypothetical protein
MNAVNISVQYDRSNVCTNVDNALKLNSLQNSAHFLCIKAIPYIWFLEYVEDFEKGKFG